MPTRCRCIYSTIPQLAAFADDVFKLCLIYVTYKIRKIHSIAHGFDFFFLFIKPIIDIGSLII